MNGIDKEGSTIIAVMFNDMSFDDKKEVSPEWASRIGVYMQNNGYRFVFNKWYLQAEPRLSLSDALLEYADDPRYYTRTKAEG